MILNILVVLIMIVITMLWGIRGKGRGLFSSLLTFGCVIVAGAIAFGLWEPIVYGALLDWRPDLAWGLGLALPFAVSLAILRLVVELTVPKNVKVDDLSNFVGGAVLGFGSAVITTGILVMSLGSVNFGPKFLGFEPIDQQNGNLVYSSGLWIPVDEWTSALYAHMSAYSFSTKDPMAIHAPDLYEQIAMNRLVYSKDATKGRQLARNDIKPDEAAVVGAYTGAKLSDFLTSATVQVARFQPKGMDGDPFPADTRMQGYVVQFQPGAREKGGQVVVGPGQVRLVYRKHAASRTGGAIHPHAIISDPEANAGNKVWFPRNAGDLFVPSVGGESTATMAFEFALPKDAVPVDLIIKGTRFPLVDDNGVPMIEATEFASASQRDAAIIGGDLFAASATSRIDPNSLDRSVAVQATSGISLSNRLGRRIINVTTGVPGTLALDEDNNILSGKCELLNRDLANRGLDPNNRIDGFAKGRDTAVLQIELAVDGNNQSMGNVVQAQGLTGKPVVFDDQGRAYDAIGYIYSDGVRTHISFQPGAPLTSMSQIEGQLTPSARDQTLILIFRPTTGITLRGFAIGDTLVGEFTQLVR